MYLKSKVKTKEQIIQQIDEIKAMLESGKQEDKFFRYEIVRRQGLYNMLNAKARQLTGLTKEDYIYIIKNYSQLMIKYPKTKDKAKRYLEYIKSANIAKVIAVKGCKNCIEIVSNKLDVKENDLCENCKKILLSYSP